MAGHSKWANIKRQKARVDAVKLRPFSCLVRLSWRLEMGARSSRQFSGRRLKSEGSWGNENIDRAIAKGAGTFGGENSNLAVRYEGYGPEVCHTD